MRRVSRAGRSGRRAAGRPGRRRPGRPARAPAASASGQTRSSAGLGTGRVAAAQHVQQQPADLAVGAGEALRPRARSGVRRASRRAARRTASASGHCGAARGAGGADQRAELHQGDAEPGGPAGVGGQQRLDRGAGRGRSTAGPASACPSTARATTRRTLVSTTGTPLPEGERRDGPGGVRADAGQREQRVDVGRAPSPPNSSRDAHARRRAAAGRGAGSRACPTSAPPRPARRRPARPASASAPATRRRPAAPGRPASAAA